MGESPPSSGHYRKHSQTPEEKIQLVALYSFNKLN